VTVGELREFCAETGAALPGLYRADGRTDRLDEPARFVPYELAEQLCRWLGHELPDSARWAGLGPEWTTREEPSFDSLSAWWHDDDDCERLRATWVASLSDEARAHADSVVRSESLSALDKWRLLCAVDTQGLAGLGPVGRAAVAMARDSVEPAFAVSGLVRRLRHDVRSLLHLTGAAEAAPAALWLRPATMVHDGRTSLLGVGALGDLGPSDRPSLLVPSRAAWADVLVWPAEMLDPTRYQERAHPWADRATRQERRT
jgi:hypothetical protein